MSFGGLSQGEANPGPFARPATPPPSQTWPRVRALSAGKLGDGTEDHSSSLVTSATFGMFPDISSNAPYLASLRYSLGPGRPSRGIEYATEEDELLDKLDGMEIDEALAPNDVLKRLAERLQQTIPQMDICQILSDGDALVVARLTTPRVFLFRVSKFSKSSAKWGRGAMWSRMTRPRWIVPYGAFLSFSSSVRSGGFAWIRFLHPAGTALCPWVAGLAGSCRAAHSCTVWGTWVTRPSRFDELCTSSKALVTSSDALVSNGFLLLLVRHLLLEAWHLLLENRISKFDMRAGVEHMISPNPSSIKAPESPKAHCGWLCQAGHP